MLRFTLQKIKNKKGLNLCLLVGIMLLAAVFSCHPMLVNGSCNRLIATAFTDYAKEHQEYPAVFSKSGSCSTKQYASAESVYELMDNYEENWQRYVDVGRIESCQYIKTSSLLVNSSLRPADRVLGISLMKNMEEHISVIRGAGFDGSVSGNGCYPCMVSRQVMDDTGLVLGEELTFPYMLDEQGEPAKFVVSGVFDIKESADNYWYHPLSYYKKQIFVSEEVMDDLMASFQLETVEYEENLLLDYTQISGGRASVYRDYIEQFAEADRSFSCNFLVLLQNYEKESRTARMVLWVLELPCAAFLLLFIHMVFGQVIIAEEREIAVFRSRGFTQAQIMQMYLLQAFLLSVLGLAFGILLGYFMCRCAASTEAFLKFRNKDAGFYPFCFEMIPCALAACVISTIFMIVPVWKKTQLTLAEQKSSMKKTGHRPFWETCFLDVLFLLASCYLLYNFNKQGGNLSESILAGESLDPVIFLDASLFIFACGLLLLRLMRYLLLLIDRLGKKRWKAANYAAFLQINRTFYKQGFISVFIVLTISMGIFHANMARTVNQNQEERIRYEMGCDMQMQEKWTMKIFRSREGDSENRWSYDEPDFGRYQQFVENGLCESVTRVLIDENTSLTAKGKTLEGCQLMGIHTREFGETAELMEGLNDRHWFYALNALAENSDGVIISRNMAEELELKEGDSVTYVRCSPLNKEETIAMESARVAAVVDCFPGYVSSSYSYNEAGELTERQNYLIAANYVQVVDAFHLTPYSVWLRLSEGTTSEEVARYAESQGIHIERCSVLEDEISKSRSHALFQITNGMFTMSFLVSALVCVTGFLLYWIMSVKSRAKMFGIYRAMGMKMKEIRQMLLTEHFFCSVLPMLAGGGLGILTTHLFVPLTAIVYLPKKHNIGIRVYLYSFGATKLLIALFAVFVLCFFLLRHQVRHMKIAQAIRLGED